MLCYCVIEILQILHNLTLVRAPSTPDIRRTRAKRTRGYESNPLQHTNGPPLELNCSTPHTTTGCSVNALQADEHMEDARRKKKLTSPEPVIVA